MTNVLTYDTDLRKSFSLYVPMHINEVYSASGENYAGGLSGCERSGHLGGGGQCRDQCGDVIRDCLCSTAQRATSLTQFLSDTLKCVSAKLDLGILNFVE